MRLKLAGLTLLRREYRMTSTDRPGRSLRKMAMALPGVARPRRFIGRLLGRTAFIRRNGWRYRHIYGYQAIPGWLSPREARMLYDLARGLPQSEPVIVEIGSWLGRSSMVLAKGLRGKKSPRLFCIDPFNADSDLNSRQSFQAYASVQEIPLRDQFAKNMKDHGVDRMIEVLAGYSTDFAGSFRTPIDLLFIDGNHDYEAVRRDYLDWAPMLKVGGMIALHDVVYEPKNDDYVGPSSVVKEYLVDQPAWSAAGLVDSLFSARKTMRTDEPESPGPGCPPPNPGSGCRRSGRRSV